MIWKWNSNQTETKLSSPIYSLCRYSWKCVAKNALSVTQFISESIKTAPKHHQQLRFVTLGKKQNEIVRIRFETVSESFIEFLFATIFQRNDLIGFGKMRCKQVEQNVWKSRRLNSFGRFYVNYCAQFSCINTNSPWNLAHIHRSQHFCRWNLLYGNRFVRHDLYR